MPGTEHYRNLVLGSGKAGKLLGWTLAKQGEHTAVIERKWIGGSCPNIACMPSKNVIHSAKVASLIARAAEFGIELQPARINMQGVRRRKRAMVDEQVRRHLIAYEDSGAELILGEGRLTGPRTIEVKTREGTTRVLSADRVFLNVGTHATIPDIPGLAASRPMTHIEALELDRVPEHLIVLGGGYVGLEFAQAMRRFGARVTILERGPQLASREDPDVGRALLELFCEEGIEVLLNAEPTNLSGVSGESIVMQIAHDGKERSLQGSHILAAAGRIPNTHGIGLREAGIELDGRGYIKVNERLETTVPGVWAVGECAGSPQFTHVAFDDFAIVRDNLNGGARTTRDRLIPFCMFTDPELARVGLNESEARERGIAYRVARMSANDILRALTISETRGFLKMLIEEHGNRILGFTAFLAGADDLIAIVQTAMLNGAPFLALRDAIFTHPTMAEALTMLLADVEVRQDQSATSARGFGA
jgi:pyruvate/2-oxoglutarate dehydrogenase complex dihydrolipoamide dehydrogenase (E3) component